MLAAQELIDERGSDVTTQELAKAAGVALQTFYRYFASKDALLLAIFEEKIANGCEDLRLAAARFEQPVERLHFYVTAAVGETGDGGDMERRFVTAEHFRLFQLFPEELTEATRPFPELLIPELEAASRQGVLHPHDVEADAWLVTRLVLVTFHHRSFVSADAPADDPEALWAFCVSALGGVPPAATGGEQGRLVG